ncbi:hypothetical protein V5O48_014748, partial [Marasmius crinis-equi]
SFAGPKSEERPKSPTRESEPTAPKDRQRSSSPPTQPPSPPPHQESPRPRPRPRPRSAPGPSASASATPPVPPPTSAGTATEEPPWERLIRDLDSQYLQFRGRARQFYEGLWRSFSWFPNLQRHPEWSWSVVGTKSDHKLYKIAIRIFHSDKLLPMMRTEDTLKLLNRITHLLLRCKELNHS